MQASKNAPESPENPSLETTRDSNIPIHIDVYTSICLLESEGSISRIASNGAPCSQHGAKQFAQNHVMRGMTVNAAQSIQFPSIARKPDPKRQPNDMKKSFPRPTFPASGHRKSGFTRR
jgi:hypothetical protein